MKRFFILASAAIVALASCAKTEVVYKDAPQEIAFKQITDVMTKADQLGDGAYTAMNVYAFTDDHTQYFTEGWVSFASQGEGTDWVATPAKYWPLSGGLHFLYYAPTDVPATAAYSTEDAYTLKVAGLDRTKDFLYGAEVKSESKTNVAMPVVLRHALTKVKVSVTSDLADLVVKNVAFKTVAVSGTLTVEYAETDDQETKNDERLVWSAVTPEDVELLANKTMVADVTQSEECYILPCTQTALVLTYNLPGAAEQTYTHTFANTDKWLDGHYYTYDITITANEIKFVPSETAWEAVTALETVIDPNMATNLQ